MSAMARPLRWIVTPRGLLRLFDPSHCAGCRHGYRARVRIPERDLAPVLPGCRRQDCDGLETPDLVIRPQQVEEIEESAS